MPASPQLAAALRVIHALRDAGHQAYLAGGCVRDLLLGRDPHDYDVATSATPDIVLNLFPRTFAVGAHFGVVLVADIAGNDGQNSAAPQVPTPQVLTEVATFRSDGAYSDGRHPDAVRYTASAKEDVLRRDFTINGLLLDPPPGPWDTTTSNPPQSGPPQKGTGFSPYIRPEKNDHGALAPDADLLSSIQDHVGGLADLRAGIIRAIGRPQLRFQEDRLRMLRAVRFAARFGFALHPATHAAIQALAPRIASVSRERVRDELTKMLTEGHARQAFQQLHATGLLQQVLPEIARMHGVDQPPQFHPEGDVFLHTLLLLDQLEPGCSPTLAWGALLHDVGKPSTFRRAPDRIRFDGHVEVGVAIAADILRRFRFSNDATRQVLALVENHMRFMDAPRMKASTLKRFFRLEGFDEHLALHRMDCRAASGNLDTYDFVRRQWLATPAEVVKPTPLLTGRELIAAGYSPGPQFKSMLRAAEDAQLEGLVSTPQQALAFLRQRFPHPPRELP